MNVYPRLNPLDSTKPNCGALILVVERNPMVQRLECYFLEQAGFSVEFAADGLTALARAQELRPRITGKGIVITKAIKN